MENRVHLIEEFWQMLEVRGVWMLPLPLFFIALFYGEERVEMYSSALRYEFGISAKQLIVIYRRQKIKKMVVYIRFFFIILGY